MAVLTTLAEVKAVARDDVDIQKLNLSDVAVKYAFDFAEKIVSTARYGSQAKEAQTYFIAHVLALSTTNAGGQGPISSESIGGVTQSFTLPYLNQRTVIASTQYGLMFLEIRNNINIPAMIIKPS